MIKNYLNFRLEESVKSQSKHSRSHFVASRESISSQKNDSIVFPMASVDAVTGLGSSANLSNSAATGPLCLQVRFFRSDDLWQELFLKLLSQEGLVL